MALSPEREALLPVVVEEFSKGGVTLRQLEERHGVDRITLYRWIFRELGEQKYDDIVTDCLVARIAAADEGMAKADSVLEVQKAREFMRFTRMDLERRRPNLYGVKQEVKHSVAPVLHIHTSGPQEKVIEGSPVPSEREE